MCTVDSECHFQLTLGESSQTSMVGSKHAQVHLWPSLKGSSWQ